MVYAAFLFVNSVLSILFVLRYISLDGYVLVTNVYLILSSVSLLDILSITCLTATRLLQYSPVSASVTQ